MLCRHGQTDVPRGVLAHVAQSKAVCPELERPRRRFFAFRDGRSVSVKLVYLIRFKVFGRKAFQIFADVGKAAIVVFSHFVGLERNKNTL